MRALLAALALLVPAFAAGAPPCDFPVPPAAAFAKPDFPPGTRVGLALGSGSNHGHAHVGVLAELEARQFPVHVVTGTSVGAMVGALWASGLRAADIDALARREEFGDLARLAGSWQGLFDSQRLRKPLEAAFRGRPIESWPVRFGAVATNIANGERRILASGDGATAVQASSAVPVFFLPIRVAGERLVDGALVEPVPVDAARDLGANFVVAIDIAYRPNEEEASGLTAYAFQAMHILVNSLAASQLRAADISIRLSVHRRWMECGRDGLVAAGRQAVDRAWPEIVRAATARRTAVPTK